VALEDSDGPALLQLVEALYSHEVRAERRLHSVLSDLMLSEPVLIVVFWVYVMHILC
jgi:hypothetical protein